MVSKLPHKCAHYIVKRLYRDHIWPYLVEGVKAKCMHENMSAALFNPSNHKLKAYNQPYTRGEFKI